MKALDHLVVAARTLDEGVAWCEATLGLTPGPGGEHVFMGTHNRLFSIASARFARAYFEIIAINPKAAHPGRVRWFDLDSPALRRTLASGPRLVHWVARCDDVHAGVARLRAAGIDPGDVRQAERQTASGPLRWQITLRADGRRLFNGALPTLIQWSGAHPADALPGSRVALESIEVSGLPADARALLPAQVDTGVDDGATGLRVTLSTARGPVVLQSPDIEVPHGQP